MSGIDHALDELSRRPVLHETTFSAPSTWIEVRYARKRNSTALNVASDSLIDSSDLAHRGVLLKDETTTKRGSFIRPGQMTIERNTRRCHCS